jgi:hypothetical protein
LPEKADEVAFDAINLKIMLLGDYGSGKSHFASTFPGPIYVFDFDGHILGYRHRDDVWFDQFELSYLGWVKFEKTLKQVQKMVEEKEISTVVVDSMTSMADIAMERALQLDPKRGSDEGPLWNVHYQIVKNLMEAKLHKILTFNANVIFNGHWKLQMDSKTGAIIGADPMLTGQLSVKIPGYFDEVYWCQAKTIGSKTEHWMHLITRGHYKARSLLSGSQRLLPEKLPNDYPSLRKAIDKLIENGQLKVTKKGK